MLAGEALPDALLRAQVLSKDGQPIVFGALTDEACVVVFLRHFGCIGCAEQVHGLVPRLREIVALGPRVILVGNGPSEHIDAFLERHGLDDQPVTVVTDPTLATFAALDLTRSRWATFGPRAVVDYVRAFTNGHRSRPTDGDLLQQGGALFAADGVVRWAHRNTSLGGHADPADLVDAILRWHVERSRVRI